MKHPRFEKLTETEQRVALRAMELMMPLTVFMTENVSQQQDMLAMRVSMELLLAHLEPKTGGSDETIRNAFNAIKDGLEAA